MTTSPDHTTLRNHLDTLIRDGLTIQHCIDAFAQQQTPAQNTLTTTARHHHLVEAGTLEVDPTTITTADDGTIAENGGGYVLAWLWTDAPEAEPAPRTYRITMTVSRATEYITDAEFPTLDEAQRYADTLTPDQMQDIDDYTTDMSTTITPLDD